MLSSAMMAEQVEDGRDSVENVDEASSRLVWMKMGRPSRLQPEGYL